MTLIQLGISLLPLPSLSLSLSLPLPPLLFLNHQYLIWPINWVGFTASSLYAFLLSFDSMKQLCERYNRAVDNIRKLVREGKFFLLLTVNTEVS